jgi:YebC/PmpR family DNA-binding regulatory protein
MSGHSKWATIKRQKGAADAKRGQLFTKLSNAITIAVKQGGGIQDPEFNFKLRLAIDRARTSNMPKENIERAIQKGSGGAGESVEELIYEGFAPGGAAVIVEAVTDNKQRTVSEIKNMFETSGGSLGTPGSVSYLFTKKGQILASKNGIQSDDLLNYGIDAGVQDMEEEGQVVLYYVDSQNLMNAKKKLEEKGIKVDSAEIVYVPTNYIKVAEDFYEKAENLVEKLEELDDVQHVYSNIE